MKVRIIFLMKVLVGCMIMLWFMIKPELCSDTDLHLRDEEDYIRLVENMEYDVIYADPCMKRMTPEFDGIFVDTIHFAVSGHLAEMR